MSIDDRKNQKDVNNQNNDKDLPDLNAKKVDEQEAERVKGGHDSFSFNQKIDKSSPL